VGNEVADDNSATSRVARRPDGFESVRAGCPKVEVIGRTSNLGYLREKWADLWKRIQNTPPRSRLLYQERSKTRSKRFLTAGDIADIKHRYEADQTTQQIGTRNRLYFLRVHRIR
jgi:hypothetical protein